MLLPLHDKNPHQFINFPYITVGILVCTIIIHIILSLAETATATNIQQGLGAIPAELLADYQRPAAIDYHLGYGTLFTSTLVHIGWLHLIGNMAFLWVFADNVEDTFGHLPFAIFYLLGAVVSGLSQAYMMDSSVSLLVGASGAVSCAFGAYVVLYPRINVFVLVLFRIPLPIPTLLLGAIWLGIQLVQVFYYQSQQVAWWSHLSGFAYGVAIASCVRVATRKKHA